ncbi:MAG TPA: hypothetical protein VMU18_03035 [Rhodoblastus sp.]|nr:hypothetical protein [Rhodoblastus sp.]
MRVVITIWQGDREIFRFEAPIQAEYGLSEIVELAFDDFTAQRPDVSLLDPNIHFTIRDLNRANSA